jgi:hypothetical protein
MLLVRKYLTDKPNIILTVIDAVDVNFSSPGSDRTHDSRFAGKWRDILSPSFINVDFVCRTHSSPFICPGEYRPDGLHDMD